MYMSAGDTRLDVVVVNFHSAALIARTIEITQEFAGAGVRVIMVDNSPGDGAANIARSAAPDATVIENPVNHGYAAAVNQAFIEGDAEFVLLINPDVRELSGSYADVLEAFRDPLVGAVAARLVNTDGTLQPNCICAPRPFDLISEDVALAERFPNWRRPRLYRMLDWDHGDARRVDAARGACIFLRRAAIEDVGSFDEHFFVYYEETDWLIRAKRRGWRTVFLPTVEAVHASAGSSPDIRSPHSLLLLESQHRYARKHFGAMTTGLLRAHTARNRHGTARPPRARRESRRQGGGGRPHPRSPHDARAPALVEQMEVSYTCSLDRVNAADWRRLAERAGHVFATPRVAPHLVPSLRERPPSADGTRTRRRRPGCDRAAVRVVEPRRSRAAVCGARPSDQLGPISAPLSEPAAAAAVGEAIAALPLPRFVLLAEHVAGDQRFGEVTAARFLYREASPVLSFGRDSWEEFLHGARAQLPPAGASLSAQAGRTRDAVVPPRLGPRAAPGRP